MKGFTLIESMVAITILTLAMTGPLFTASRAIIAAETSRDQLTAAYLAQEGIEYVRAMRDNEYLLAYHTGGQNISGDAWSAFLNNPSTDLSSVNNCNATVNALQACTLDPVSGVSTQSCSTGVEGSCMPLRLIKDDSGRSLYRQQSSGGTPTPFTRTIQVLEITASETKVLSKVSWNYHGTPYSITVSDHLTAWQ